ncbi:MAG: GNAT family N-acetyltransferase [Phycisphaeraceae bacterium]|nr:GNAT family N-acetyltransferase [Phycisphaeraceae bacterium]
MDTELGLDASPVPIRPEHRATFDQAFTQLKQPISDYSFPSLLMWADALSLRAASIDRHVCVFSEVCGDLTLIIPPIPQPGATERDLRHAVESAFDVMDAHNDRLGDRSRSRIEYVSDELLERFHAAPGLQLSATPLWSDYVYSTPSLVDLSGGALKSKRHARAKFMREFPGHRTAEIRREDVEPCVTLLERWANRGDQTHEGEVNDTHVGTDVLRHRDRQSTIRLLRSMHDLALPSMALWVDDALVGFTIGEQLSPGQAMIIVEKCDASYAGSAQFIFSEFCRLRWSNFPETNVGDDWGIPSLRFTKQSYRPVRLLAKYTLTRQAVVVSAGINLNDIPNQNPPHRVEAAASVSTVETSSPSVTVRPAVVADVPSILEIERACFSTLEETFNRRQVKALVVNPRATVSVAEVDGRVVGWSVGLMRQHRRTRSGRLYAIAIHPSTRGRRLGRLLAEATLSQLSALGLERVYLEVRADNEPAIGLYRKLGFGFKKDLPNYYGHGRHGLRMVRVVPRAAGLHEASQGLHAT